MERPRFATNWSTAESPIRGTSDSTSAAFSLPIATSRSWETEQAAAVTSDAAATHRPPRRMRQGLLACMLPPEYQWLTAGDEPAV
jgi:hypothetical protein